MKPIIPLHIAPFILAILLLIAGCSDTPDPRLLSAQRDMDLNPDSILTTLESLDTTEFNSHSLALYKLLHTQALDKTDRLPANFPEISDALDYFSKHGNDREKMMANFYQGQTEYIGKDYEQAMRLAFEAYQYSLKVNQPYWIAKTAEFVADICSASFLSDDYLKFEQIAIDNYRLDNSRGNYEYALCDYAYEKIYRGEVQDGIRICDSIFKVSKNNSNHQLAINAAYNLLDGYYRTKQVSKGLEIYRYLKSRPEYTENPYNLILVAGLYRLRHELDSATNYLKASALAISSEREKTAFFEESKLIFLLQGDTAKAYTMGDSLFNMQASYLHNLLGQPAVRAQKNYFSEESSRRDRIIEERNIVITILLLLLAGIILISVLYFRQRERIKNLEKEALLNEISRLHSSLSELNQDIENVNREKENDSDRHTTHIRELGDLFLSQLSTIGMLAKEYFERGGIESARGEMMKSLEKEIKLWRSDEKIQEMEQVLNLCSENIVGRIRKQCPDLSEKNITFLIYLWIGFSPKAVALFCNLKNGSFYTNRKRIVEKIRNSAAKDKEEFLQRCKI